MENLIRKTMVVAIKTVAVVSFLIFAYKAITF